MTAGNALATALFWVLAAAVALTALLLIGRIFVRDLTRVAVRAAREERARLDAEEATS